MVRNQTVLEALLDILAQRGTDLDAWEMSIGWEAGSTAKALQPPDGNPINRNIKLLAHHLQIDPLEFFQALERREQDKG